MSLNGGRPSVVVIGGGFTGAALAFQLSQLTKHQSIKITVIEPRDALGQGAAYGTIDPSHRINVPASRMTFHPGNDEHFQNWLVAHQQIDRDASTSDGRIFAQRQTFGHYVSSEIAPLIENGRIEHLHAKAMGATRYHGQWHVTSDNGIEISADVMVLATTHPKPSPPRQIDGLVQVHEKYIDDPVRAGALAAVGQDDKVLIIGAGLTSADIVASLSAKKHRGHIQVISRRGLRSRGHADVMPEPYGEFIDPPSQTAGHLLRRIRSTISAAKTDGVSWHAVLDRVRSQGTDIWAHLSISERRRLVRHLRPFWDVHRFRIAPQVEAVLDQKVSDGTLSFNAASLRQVSLDDDGKFIVTIKKRYSTEVETHIFDAIINATGPGHSAILTSQSLMSGLAARGYIALDRVGLGLEVDEFSRAIAAGGAVSPSVYIAGPLARGQFGELMGLPQVTEHAHFVARQVADALAAEVIRTERLTANG